MIVFGQQGDAVGRQPQIMDGRLTEPLAARMVRVELLVSRRRRALLKGSVLNDRGSRGVMTRVEQLAGFQQHLDDVLVDGVPRRLSGTAVKKEDIHREGGEKTVGKTGKDRERQQKAHRTNVVLGDFNFSNSSNTSLHHPLHLISLIPLLLRPKACAGVQSLGRFIVLVDFEEDAVVASALGVGEDAGEEGPREAGASILGGHHEGGEVQGRPCVRLVRSAKGGQGQAAVFPFSKPRVIPSRGPVLGEKVGDRKGSAAVRREKRSDTEKSVGRPELQRWNTRGEEIFVGLSRV